MRKFIKKIIIKVLQNKGYSSYSTFMVFEDRYKDFFKNNNASWKQKIWAQRRGFLSEKIGNYRLDEKNYKNYLSDFDYYKLHPINGRYSHWIDDKLTLKFILAPFSRFMPNYFYHLQYGEIFKLDGCPDIYGKTVDDIKDLLVSKRYLALKLVSGELAEGFFKLSYINEKYYINNKISSEIDLIDLLIKLVETGNYLITEYLFPHQELGKIWGETPNTLRLMVINESSDGPKLVRAYWRFGSKLSGVVDNPAVGGVICDVDIESGYFNRGASYQGEILEECLYHPDTGVLVEGTTPYWEIIKIKINEICEYVPELIYLGFDVIITDEGFKIIEINSHQGIKYLQYFKPLLIDNKIRSFFQKKMDEKKQKQENRKNNRLIRRIIRRIKRLFRMS